MEGTQWDPDQHLIELITPGFWAIY